MYNNSYNLKTSNYLVKIIDMNNKQEIKLDRDKQVNRQYHDLYDCTFYTFNPNGDFITCNGKEIQIYSTRAKNNEWICQKIYEISEDFELIGISKYDELYSSNCIYEWNILT